MAADSEAEGRRNQSARQRAHLLTVDCRFIDHLTAELFGVTRLSINAIHKSPNVYSPNVFDYSEPFKLSPTLIAIFFYIYFSGLILICWDMNVE
jgi:hypothetical protein